MLFSASSILRQSTYCLALGYFLKDSAACGRSQSHSATMLDAVPSSPRRSSNPRPPAPTTATLTLSLGEILRRTLFCARRRVVVTTVVAAAAARKERREIERRRGRGVMAVPLLKEKWLF